MLYLGDDALQQGGDMLPFSSGSGHGGEDFMLAAASDAPFSVPALPPPDRSPPSDHSDQAALGCGGGGANWHSMPGDYHQQKDGAADLATVPQSFPQEPQQLYQQQLQPCRRSTESTDASMLHPVYLDSKPNQQQLQHHYHDQQQSGQQVPSHSPPPQQQQQLPKTEVDQQQDPTLAALLGDWMLDGCVPASGGDGEWEATVQQAAASMQDKYTPWATAAPAPLTAGPAGLPASAR